MPFVLLILLSIVAIPASAAGQGIVSYLLKPGKYASSPAHITWSASPEIAPATYTVLMREVLEDRMSPWKEVTAPDETLSATETLAPVEDGRNYQFRVSANTAQDAQRLVITRFEPGESTRMILPVWHRNAMSITLGYMPQDPPEGQLFGEWRFRLMHTEMIDPATPSFSGFYFTNRMPKVDWSAYRYLEFLYRTSHPDVPLRLNLKSGMREMDVPLASLVETHTTAGDWKSVVVDLEKHLQKYSTIDRFAIVGQSLDFPAGEDFVIAMDDVVLWKNRDIHQATIDATPPSPPDDFNRRMNGLFVEWRWAPSVDDESGIVGYSVSWSRDFRDMPDSTVDVTRPGYREPFIEPDRYLEYYFRIKALNGAGAWSEVVTETVTYNPSAPHQDR